MILGRGQARTESAIIAEYHDYLSAYHPVTSRAIQVRLRGVPVVMAKRIGKPLAQWTDEEILALFANRAKSTHYAYSVFLAFLFFRGYRQATLFLLNTLRMQLSRHFRKALAPHRQRIVQAGKALGYVPDSGTSSHFNLLLAMLAVVGKPLEALTRADFEDFRDQYQSWYQRTQQQRGGKVNSRLTRVEFYLIHWGIILPPTPRILRHEEHFARLRHESIRLAILAHLQWCAAKYKPSTIYSRRAALLNFFLWFQDRYPNSARLDSVTRSVALAYARTLKRQVEEGAYSLHYASDLQRGVRAFYDFAIDERLDTSPGRNPFTLRDLPRRADPVPRYLSDREVRAILNYCENGASLKERTIVITLLHTGIRAAELAALRVTSIVQIQGTWKLHIKEGKGLKDRLIPLTPQCLEVLQTWQRQGWEGANDFLFTYHGRPWTSGSPVGAVIRNLGLKIGLKGLAPHRFRHTFAVALLNYGMRESALQKLMGHATLNMTLEYGRILDKTVEQAFNTAVAKMQTGPISWVPYFFRSDEYAILADSEAINWIRLPHGYCRRHPKLHCESDVKCLLCDRFCSSAIDLPRLEEMHTRFQQLDMALKADVVNVHIVRLRTAAGANGNQIAFEVTST